MTFLIKPLRPAQPSPSPISMMKINVTDLIATSLTADMEDDVDEDVVNDV
jgi:hypothetical protein